MHRGHSEELPGFLLEEEVPAAPLGRAHLPETPAGPAGPPGLRPAAAGEEEEGGRGGAAQEGGGGDGEVLSLSLIFPTSPASGLLTFVSFCPCRERLRLEAERLAKEVESIMFSIFSYFKG